MMASLQIKLELGTEVRHLCDKQIRQEYI